MFDLAFFLWSNKQFDEAIAVSGALIENLAERPGESLWIDALHLQSMALHDAKRDSEAIEAELLALKYGETLEPASERAFMHWHLADCYRTTEQPELQEAEYLKAIEAFVESENKFFLGQAYIDLANLYYSARRYGESKTYFNLAGPVLEETQRTDRMTFVKYRLSGIERHLGNPINAVALAEDAVQLSSFIDDVVATRENKIELALAHEELGNYETAISLLDSLIEDNDDQLKNRSAAKAIYYRARMLIEIGQAVEALKAYDSCIPILRAVGLEDLAINAELQRIHMKERH